MAAVLKKSHSYCPPARSPHEHVPGMQKNRQSDTIPERGYARPETTPGVTFNTPTIAITTICVGENPRVVQSCGSRKTGEGRRETEQKEGGMKTGSSTSNDDKDGDGIWSVCSMPKDTPPSVLMRTPHQHHIIFILTSPFARKIFLANARILDLSGRLYGSKSARSVHSLPSRQRKPSKKTACPAIKESRKVQVCGINAEVLEVQQRGYPDLQIAYLEEAPLASTVVNRSSTVVATGFKIKDFKLDFSAPESMWRAKPWVAEYQIVDVRRVYATHRLSFSSFLVGNARIVPGQSDVACLMASILSDPHSLYSHSNTWDSKYIPFSSRGSYSDIYDMTKLVQPDATFNDEAYRGYCHLDISTMFTISYGLSFVNTTITITYPTTPSSGTGRSNINATCTNMFYINNEVHDYVYKYSRTVSYGCVDERARLEWLELREFPYIALAGKTLWQSTRLPPFSYVPISNKLQTDGSDITIPPSGLRASNLGVQQPACVRTYCSTNASSTGSTTPADISEVWANILHSVYTTLVEVHGFSSTAMDDPSGTEGNIVWLRLFIDPLSLQPCNPTPDEHATIPTARDAWIQAHQNRYDGANACTLWNAFVSRGVGVNAANYVDDASVPSAC
ncbi:Fungalysin metallopeptidase-domain-containing protein [Armillaria nabsnona]|nr:Fungalysin metallopeptidase-domain-containing protein [Armillaria nabsnona]